MRALFEKRSFVCLAAAFAVLAVGAVPQPAFAKKKKKPAATATQVPPVVIPWRPTPPLWAAENVAIPPIGADGKRQTINANIGPAQRTWNFRSAYNVAALNCRDSKYNETLAAYRLFLTTHRSGLAAANTAMAADFRKRYGAGGNTAREAYMTKVYNFYSFPPTLSLFCDAALAMAPTSRKVARANLSAFAAAELPKLDAVFDKFFTDYEQYRVNLAEWETKWGALSRERAAAAAAATAAAATKTKP